MYTSANCGDPSLASDGYIEPYTSTLEGVVVNQVHVCQNGQSQIEQIVCSTNGQWERINGSTCSAIPGIVIYIADKGIIDVLLISCRCKLLDYFAGFLFWCAVGVNDDGGNNYYNSVHRQEERLGLLTTLSYSYAVMLQFDFESVDFF